MALRVPLALVACVLLAAPAARAGGTTSRDNTSTVRFPEVVVTALRGQDRLSAVPSASFVFSRERIQQSGVSRITGLLQTLPGLFGYQQNSSGEAQVVDPRGFTASGESSYLKLLIDGQDVRDVENGNVDWDWILPHDIERIEVIQGPGAWLYGDGSEGGIVNVVRPAIPAGLHSDCGAQFGSFGLAAGSMVLSAQQDALAGSLRSSARRVQGWREHSRDRVLSGGGEARWTIDEGTRFTLSAALLDAHRQDPGALRPDQLAEDRAQSDTESDFVHPRRLSLGAQLRHGRPGASEWTLSPYLRAEDVSQVRTILYQTKSHPTEAFTPGAGLSWRHPLSWSGRAIALSAEAQAEQARLRSRYYDFENGTRGVLNTDGESRRGTASGFFGARIEPDHRTLVRVGFRQDAIRVQSEDRPDTAAIPRRTFWLGSPFVAASRRVGERGTVYGSYSSAFRVPTLNQLYDRRPFFNPFTFETVYLSNRNLRPQTSRGVEVGARLDGARGAYALVTLYSIRVRDEIDFDGATNTYANLSRSWHRGAQLGARQPLGDRWFATGSASYAPTTIRGGALDGNQINGVPRSAAYGSLRFAPSPVWSAEAGVRMVGRQFLDKANQHPLNGFATMDLAGTVSLFARVRATLRVANLLDHKYSDSGYFVDLGPALQEERLYPAPGRGFTVSLTAD